MLVLGIDPGLQETGYGYVEGATGGVTLLQAGVIRTPPGGEFPARLLLIYQQLHDLLKVHRPSVVAIEDIYAAARYPRTAIIMGHVRGVVCLAAAEAGIGVIPLPPASVKQAVAGFGAASKRQLQVAVGRFLRLPQPLNPHEADAIAMALTVLSRAGQMLPRRAGHRERLARGSGTKLPVRVAATGRRG